jgi:hypothetical protein
MAKWLIAAVTARSPFLLKLTSWGLVGRLGNTPTACGLAGFLIDQIWTRGSVGPASDFETYTYGLVGCAVTL